MLHLLFVCEFKGSGLELLLAWMVDDFVVNFIKELI